MQKLLLLILVSFIVADEYYTIRSGDTLSGIASRYGVSVSDLVSWNNIANPNLIYAGQKIIVKKSGSGGSSTPSTPSSSGSYKITASQMQRMGWTNYNLDDLNSCIKRFDITTTQRIRHFISQTSHESGCGKWTKELGGQSYCSKYDWRKDLGNTQAGDGCRFKGAGYIQLTGRANYQAFANFIKDQNVMQGVEYVASKYPWTSAGFWWYNNGMNRLCDNGASVETITRRVNGGLNGLADRKKHYLNACNVFK